MQVSKRGVNRSVEKKIFRSFCQALANIKDPKAITLFFKDILSPTERAVLAKRLAIAWYLKQNKSYSVIKTELKVSSATVATMQELMAKNPEGINLALKTIEADEWAGEWADKISAKIALWLKNFTSLPQRRT